MAKKNRFLRPLIQVEGGSLMLKSRALQAVDSGRAVLVSGMVRFLDDQTHLGYNTAAEYSSFAGRQSYDPDMGGGPQVVQFFRPKFEL